MEDLKQYLKAVGFEKPLSREEEEKIILSAKAGNDKDMARLIRSNIKFIIGEANKLKYDPKSFTREDILSYAVEGFLTAVKKYDPKCNCVIRTYAKSWIYKCIQKAIQEEDAMIRQPVSVHADRDKYLSYKENLPDVYSDDEAFVDSTCGLTKRRLQAVKNSFLMDGIVDIDKKISFDSDDKIGDNIEDKETPRPDNYCESRELNYFLGRFLNQLPVVDSFVIKAKAGYGMKKHSREEISSETGLSIDKIRSIEKKVYNKFIEKENLKYFYGYLDGYMDHAYEVEEPVA